MHELLSELQSFHHQTSEKAGDLARFTKVLAQNGEDHVRETILEMLEAFNSEEEHAHHHNEELIREALISTGAPIHRRVEQIEKDHHAFGRIMSNLLDQCRDHKVSSAVLSSQINDYIDKYFDHLEAEETIFFPMADKWLEEEQWEAIKKSWQQPSKD